MHKDEENKSTSIRLADFREALAASKAQSSEQQWELADYTTTGGNGVMLLCRAHCTPPPVTVRPKLNGWHRIYVCLVCNGFPCPGLSLKLTDDLGASFFRRSLPTPKYPIWNHAERGVEVFWQCADMTGQDITITKLIDDSAFMVGLLWLRFEPMTAEQVEAHLAEGRRRDVRTLHAHTDLDWLHLVQQAPRDLFAPFVQSMVQSDAELLSVEFYPLLINRDFIDRQASKGKGDDPYLGRFKAFREFVKSPEETYSWLTGQCHAHGLRVYAALRHCLSVCPFPYDATAIAEVDFATNHPELYCVDRDGEPFGVISYAFPEAQDYLIGECLKVLPYGFDGLTLFFHRGVMIAFEQPVLDRFRSLYPDVDPRLLPLDDERLVRVHCDLMTGFMRRLRQALDDWAQAHGRGRLGLAVVGGYALEDNARFGVDIARWAEEGIIDTVVVGNMVVYEDIEKFQDEAHPGLIDLDKYRQIKYHGLVSPVRRFFDNDIDRMLKAMPPYLELEKRTKLAVYFDVPWECTRPPEFFRDYAIRLYEAGAKHISLWDAFHTRVMNRTEWNIVSRLGHRDELSSMTDDENGYGQPYRLLSVNGRSLAAYHPAWRG